MNEMTKCPLKEKVAVTGLGETFQVEWDIGLSFNREIDRNQMIRVGCSY